jgi:hypothetical protein
MKLTATQLKQIIMEEVQKARLSEDAQLRVTDADSGATMSVSVVEGPVPYSVRLQFGASFGVTLHLEDAEALGQRLLGKALDAAETTY